MAQMKPISYLLVEEIVGQVSKTKAGKRGPTKNRDQSAVKLNSEFIKILNIKYLWYL